MAKKKIARPSRPSGLATAADANSFVGDDVSRRYSQKVLDYGFIVALAMASVSLVLSAVYLYSFLLDTNSSVHKLMPQSQEPQGGDVESAPVAQQPDAEILRLAILSETVMVRLALKSCGVFVAMSFGFLGFSLFLMGIKGEMDVEARGESYQVKIARMSPGVFVILCSAVLTGICVTHRVEFNMSQATETIGGAEEQAAGLVPKVAPLTELKSGPGENSQQGEPPLQLPPE